MVDAFTHDAALAGALGQVRAKTGTFVEGNEAGALVLRTQAMAGYITARSGRRLNYVLAVENVPLAGGVDDLFAVMQDQGVVSAEIWRGY